MTGVPVLLGQPGWGLPSYFLLATRGCYVGMSCCHDLMNND